MSRGGVNAVNIIRCETLYSTGH